MFDFRWLTSEDYEQLKGWWRDHHWTPPPQQMLPDNGKCGIMISKNGENICAGFIYFTNSTVAWIEFIIANKQYQQRDKKLALKELVNTISEISRSQGFSVLFTSLESKSLIKLFKECDFVVGDEGVTQLIKTL